MVPLVLRRISLCFAVGLAVAGQCGFSQEFITPENVTPGPNTNSSGYQIYGGPGNPTGSAQNFWLYPILGVADFNGDHKPDVLTTYNPNGTVSSGTPSFAVLINNGDGTFTRRVLTNSVYPSDRTAFVSVKIADANGDGKQDIVVTAGSGENSDFDPIGPSTLYVYLGQGDGTFHALAPQAISANMDAAIVVAADLNGDGKADLLINIFDNGSNQASTDEILLGSSTGVYHPGGSLPANLEGDVQAADMYGQGHLDFVLVGGILKNDGHANFSIGTDLPYGEITAIGDFNHDGLNDLVIATGIAPDPGSTQVLLNRGGGNFTQTMTLNYVTYGTGVVTDLTGDGLADLLTAGPGGLLLLAGKGDGTFAAPTTFSMGFPFFVADFDGDGKPDVLTTESVPFLLAKGDGHGNFAAPRVTTTSQYPTVSEAIAAGDFNGDGKPDIAVVNELPCYLTGLAGSGGYVCPHATVSVSPGTGQGYQGPIHYFPVGVPEGVIAVGDVNNDGKMDIVVVRAANIPVAPLSTNFDTSVLLGKGDGTFQASKDYHVLGYPGTNPAAAFDAAVYLLDVNKDGKLDLVGDWGVAMGNGDGSFQAPIPLPSGLNFITGLVAGDFNRDGKIDLVVGSFDGSNQTQTLKTLIGDGKGSFTITHTTSFSVTGFPQGEIFSMAAADLNGDGVPDLVYSGYKYNSATGTNNGYGLYVQVCNGNGTFATPTKVPSPAAFNLVTGDFNRDGHIDVLVGGYGAAGDLALFKGVGNGTLSSTPQWYSSNSINNTGVSLGVVNLNSDTAPDVVNLVLNGFERVLNTGAH